MDTDQLLAVMEAEFAVTGAETPSWADPNPERDPAPETYSRLLEPEKYQILVSRAEAWARTLVHLGLAERADLVAPDGAAPWGQLDGRTSPHRTLRLLPYAEGALPLLLGVSEYQPDAGVQLLVGFGEPAVLLEDVPDCGCDACDSGSADLLALIDERILDVVTGAAVWFVAGRSTYMGFTEGWRSTDSELGGDQTDALIAQARTGQLSGQLSGQLTGQLTGLVVHGAPWW